MPQKIISLGKETIIKNKIRKENFVKRQSSFFG